MLQWTKRLGAALTVGVAGLWLALATPASAQSDENAGVSWKPIFDTKGSCAIGVVEIAPSDAKTIRVGTGKNNAQRSVGFGDHSDH